MAVRVPVLLTITLVACAQGKDGDKIDAPAAADAAKDAPKADAAIDAPAAGALPLILTEVVLTPTAGEYVELANPSTDTIDLSTSYLSDSGNYFRLPEGAPTVDATDFVVKFPAGATLGPKATITVALATAGDFSTTYAKAPSFSIVGGTMMRIAGVDP